MSYIKLTKVGSGGIIHVNSVSIIVLSEHETSTTVTLFGGSEYTVSQSVTEIRKLIKEANEIKLTMHETGPR